MCCSEDDGFSPRKSVSTMVLPINIRCRIGESLKSTSARSVRHADQTSHQILTFLHSTTWRHQCFLYLCGNADSCFLLLPRFIIINSPACHPFPSLRCFESVYGGYVYRPNHLAEKSPRRRLGPLFNMSGGSSSLW